MGSWPQLPIDMEACPTESRDPVKLVFPGIGFAGTDVRMLSRASTKLRLLCNHIHADVQALDATAGREKTYRHTRTPPPSMDPGFTGG